MDPSLAFHPPSPDDDPTVYPESDGEPMAESPWHRDQMFHLIESLRQLLAGRNDAHIGGNEMFYWERGNARKSLSPDVWVGFGLLEPVPPLGSYKLWVQGKGPDLVVEVGSSSTRAADRGHKKDLYRDVFEVSEYVLIEVDVDEGFVDFRDLCAWRRDALGRYRPVAIDLEVGFVSRVLDGARLHFERDLMRVIDREGHVMPGCVREGLAQGFAIGFDEGRSAGFDEGHGVGFDEGRSAGFDEGRSAGFDEGALGATRSALFAVLTVRFGALPAALRARLEAERSAERLQALLVRAATVATLEELE